jgi:hypothetical protein
MLALSRVRALVICLACVVGCDASRGVLTLSWQLADGRDCFAGAVTRVYVGLAPLGSGDPGVAQFDCDKGLWPLAVTVADVPGNGTLYVDGRSAQDAVLYHGELDVGGAPLAQPRSVTLYALAAQ